MFSLSPSSKFIHLIFCALSNPNSLIPAFNHKHCPPSLIPFFPTLEFSYLNS